MAARAPQDGRFRIVSIVGTRPEAIKMAPVARALAARPYLDHHIILTGQHSRLDGSFAVPGRGIETLDVDPAELTAGELCEILRDALAPRLWRRSIDLVLVQGDTTSALAGALAANDCGIPLGHVEAGLRSFDRQQPWPEEDNRVLIDSLADLLFAPTKTAAANLAAEKVQGEIFITGNSGIDALFHARAALPAQRRKTSDRKLLLVTCHRRENRGAAVDAICGALGRLVIAYPIEVVVTLHPNQHVRAGFEQRLANVAHVRTIEPVDHAGMVELIERSWAILTDSGGLQEEGAAMGRPVLVLREVTERTEADSNIALVGTSPDRITETITSLLADETRYARMAVPNLAFGDGRAAPRIAEAIEAYLARDLGVAST